MNERAAPPFIWRTEDNAKDVTKAYYYDSYLQEILNCREAKKKFPLP